MLKEIHDQPETAELWVARHLPVGLPVESPVALPFDDAFYADIEQIQILACGTSRHAALVGAYLLEQFAGIPATVFYASEFRYAPPPLAPHTLTVGVTQSGETADTLAALCSARPTIKSTRCLQSGRVAGQRSLSDTGQGRVFWRHSEQRSEQEPVQPAHRERAGHLARRCAAAAPRLDGDFSV